MRTPRSSLADRISADVDAVLPAAIPMVPAFSPLYRQIKGLILNSLRSGEWKPGEVIPSEIELAARFQVSQGTVRKAVDELAAENLLLRRQCRDARIGTAEIEWIGDNLMI